MNFKTLAILLAALGTSCAGAPDRALPAALEPEARALAKGRDGQILTSASESPSLLYAVHTGEKGGMDLYYAASHDEGSTFAAPLRVNAEPGEVSSHGENAPQIRLGPGGEILVAWEGRGDIRFARCVDFGRSFGPTVSVNDDKSGAYQSFFAMEAGADGAVYLAWIDFRDGKIDPPGTASIYLARSDDRGASFAPNVKVAGGVCPCCRPAIAVGRDGRVDVAFRGVLDGAERDVVISSSSDRGATWKPATPVSRDHWKLEGCPHSGPSLLRMEATLMVAWYTGARGKADLRVAASSDGGATFGPARSVEGPFHDANHPSLALLGGEPWLSFQAREPGNQGGWGLPRVALVRLTAQGEVRDRAFLPTAGGSAGYPRLTGGNAGRFYVVWTESDAKESKVVLCRGRLNQR